VVVSVVVVVSVLVCVDVLVEVEVDVTVIVVVLVSVLVLVIAVVTCSPGFAYTAQSGLSRAEQFVNFHSPRMIQPPFPSPSCPTCIPLHFKRFLHSCLQSSTV